MISACIARLISTFSGLKLQALINAQIDAKNCLEWGEKISKEEYFDEIESIHPIHSRLKDEPDFFVGEIYYSSIKNLIISFSSTLEFFLKDSIRLNMMRNYTLLKKGLIENKFTINPKDIVDCKDIEEIRLKYILNLSEYICSGELWKNKLKKYIKLLSLPDELWKDSINNRIDSIWEARNDIAHANTRGLSLNYEHNTYTYNSNIGVTEYTQFVLLFIKLVDDVIDFLSQVDKLSLDKWKATDATLLYRK